MNKKLIALALAGGMVMAGCGNNVNKTKETKEDVTQEASTNEAASKTGLSDVKVNLDKAVESFKETFPNKEITLTGISLEVEGNSYIYDVEGYDKEGEYQASIDANSGEILNQEEDQEKDNEDANEVLDLSSIIKADEAIEKAESANEGSKAKEWSLSVHDGYTVYEIELDNGKDVSIDASNGEFLVFD